ncbi:MAG: DivIVA domain-containing protein [Firmicutes bacterium]|nr:DivIVA domain-containing protein [Bacillota bacterium]
MLTPSDIENLQFKKVALGYSVDEVDEFIDKLLVDYEKVFRDNVKLNSKVAMLEENIKRFESMEDAIRSSIKLAEKAAKDTKDMAEEQADNILDRAEIEAEKLVAKTFEQKKELEKEIYGLKKSYELLRTRIKHTLMAELEMLEEDIFDKDDVPEKKQVKYSGKQSARDEVEFDYANGFEDEFDEYDDEELDEKLDDDLDDDDDFDDDDFDDDDFDSELGDTPLTVPDPEAAKKAEQERKLKALGELFEES